MDPVSTLLAAYLNNAEDPVAESWLQGNDRFEKTISVEFEGYSVHYNYLLWDIKRDSLCNRYQLKNLNTYSSCTDKAISLFGQTCSKLTTGGIKSRYREQLKTMYCSAARDFKPAVAMIKKSNNNDELLNARRDCNAATLKAQGSSDTYLIRKRDVLCETYQLLKQ